MNLTTEISAIQKHGIINPAEITTMLLDKLNQADHNTLLEALRVTLPCFVLRTQGTERKTASDKYRTATRVIRQKSTPKTSWKVAEVRDAWQARLDTIIHIDGESKKLRDCVKADLLNYANNLRNQADALNRNADEYQALAAKLPDDTTTLGMIAPIETEVAA